jgi:hypothetical protein
VCALHHAEHLVSERSNEASLALDLLKPWRAEAEFHGRGNLVAALDRIAEDERRLQEEVCRELEAFRRIALESDPDHELRMRTGKGGRDV